MWARGTLGAACRQGLAELPSDIAIARLQSLLTSLEPAISSTLRTDYILKRRAHVVGVLHKLVTAAGSTGCAVSLERIDLECASQTELTV